MTVPSLKFARLRGSALAVAPSPFRLSPWQLQAIGGVELFAIPFASFRAQPAARLSSRQRIRFLSKVFCCTYQMRREKQQLYLLDATTLQTERMIRLAASGVETVQKEDTC
jgi:hypothetical protein